MNRDALIFLAGGLCWWLTCQLASAVPPLPPALTARAPEPEPEQFPDRALLDALAFVESSHNPRAVSPVGARGLYQFMQPTWEDVMTEPFTQAFNPVSAETAAIRYLDWIRDTLIKWKGGADLRDVLACWHGGIGRYKRRGYNLARMPKSTRVFVGRVVSEMRVQEN